MKYIFIIFLSLACSFHFAFADEFSSIKCGSDIAKAVIGKKAGVKKVKIIERKYKALGLKNLGSDGLAEDSWVTTHWLICGKEYLFLIGQINKKSVISDVVEIPVEFVKHRRALPGTKCTQNTKVVSDAVYAILNEDSTAAKAWRIEENEIKFREIPVNDFHCAKD